MLQIAFRTDASLDIGTGHVMRCLTLASALRERGAVCRFICRDLPGNRIAFIREQGFDVQALPLPHADDGVARSGYAAWLGVDWTTDARECMEAGATLFPEGIDWLVVDHYALDVRWEEALRASCRRLLAIDDLADRPHHCDVLIDQNIGRTPADYAARVNPRCQLLTGTQHALLRPEFAAFREDSLARRAGAPLREMLISLGGVDKDNATGAVLEGLRHCDLPGDLTITIVMGAQAPWLTEVKEQAAALPWRTRIAINVSDMASLMASADIAIGAAGTTTWERCCLGLPSLVLGTAENQRYVLSQLRAQDVVVLADVEQLRAEPRDLAPSLKRLVDHRLDYGRRAAALTEGRGCAQLADLMFDMDLARA